MVRFATGVPVFLGAMALAAWGPAWTVGVLVALTGCYGMVEYLRMVSTGSGEHLPRVILVVGAALIGLGGLTGIPAALSAGLAAAGVLALGAIWFSPGGGKGTPMQQAALSLAGLLMVPWAIGHTALLLPLPLGNWLFLWLVVVVSACDTFAFVVGSFLGRTKLVPSISPKKTVEGSLAGMAAGVFFGWLAADLWLNEPGGYPFGLWWGVIAAAMALFAQAGDLMESKLKRLNDADDSGMFMPGHGGILDRVDGYLLAGPAFYYLTVFVLT